MGQEKQIIHNLYIIDKHTHTHTHTHIYIYIYILNFFFNSILSIWFILN
jgi:hypothetical protein